MKIGFVSDIHLEFNDWKFDPSWEFDVFVIAGDLHTKLNGLHWIKENVTDRPVIYVLGNHEYYTGESIDFLADKMKRRIDEWQIQNVHLLENEYVDLDGVRFIGATLWTDYNLLSNHHLSMMIARDYMNDFQIDCRKNIRKGYGKRVEPSDFLRKHSFSKKFIFENITENTVVITHHAPSGKSVREFDSLSPAYASELGYWISNSDPAPKIWIHGHTHYNVDYMINKTRVLTNQRGYEDENFQPLIFEL